MANQEHLDILKQGVEAWNRWRRENPTLRPDLSGENLHWMYLDRINLRGANVAEIIFVETSLRKAVLTGAELGGANLSYADLSEAYLHGAKLGGASLSWANLSNAQLKGVNLQGADLRGADLHETDLTRTHVGQTIFDNIDLSVVKGLDTVIHERPSTIGIDTIYRSRGNIPGIFLRGAGVPDSFIEYAASLVGKAVDFYSVFISYSSKDEEFSRRMYADLQSNGVRCWYAAEDLKIGEKFRIGIDESIRIHDKLLLILSEHSVTSDWVEQEVETALAKERDTGELVLFPVRLDDAVIKVNIGWPALIRNTRHIGDFRQWKDHDEYQKSFQRLIIDLKAEA